MRTIKKALFDCQAQGTLARVKVIDLTNCTFDGHMYNPALVMEECLAIKPDLIFLWDEAWFGFARFNAFHRRRTAMGAAETLTARYRDPAYRDRYAAFVKAAGPIDPKNPALLDTHLLPDPDKVRIRVYQTCSTHKSMSALRQGSMMLVWDDDFHHVEGCFQEAFLAHTSTSPNQQIIASLDIARRQMELEGYELTMRATEMALRVRREVNEHPLISKYFRIATPAEMVPAAFRKSGIKDYGRPHPSWKELLDAWDNDEFALDPTRLTLICGSAGFDGTQFKGLLAERFDIQINKTSRNSVLLQANINNTRSDVALLIKALSDLSREIQQRLAQGGPAARAAFDQRVQSLMTDVPDLPNFSRFHDVFRDDPGGASNEGHMREAFFMAYDEANCEFLRLASPEIDARLKKGPPLVSANFVIPYPPGFPIMVPGPGRRRRHHHVHAQTRRERDSRLSGGPRFEVAQTRGVDHACALTREGESTWKPPSAFSQPGTSRWCCRDTDSSEPVIHDSCSAAGAVRGTNPRLADRGVAALQHPASSRRRRPHRHRAGAG